MATQVGKQKYDKGKYVKTDNTDQTIGVNNSLVRSANVNSNENSTVSAASLIKSGSSDVFKFNPAMEQRILAAKDRQSMRQQARARKLSGGDDVKSQFVPTAKEGSKLYEKNLKLQNKLNKKFPQPVSTGGSTVTNSNINNTSTSVISNVSGATSIKPQANINKPPAQAVVIDAFKKSTPASSGTYTLSSTKDKPISGADYYTPHALNTEENFNTIAKQVGNKDELSTNYARALDIKDDEKSNKAVEKVDKEDELIFNLLFSKPSIKL